MAAAIATLRLDWSTMGYRAIHAARTAHGISLDALAPDAPQQCPACGTPCTPAAARSLLQIHDLPSGVLRVTLRIRRASQRCSHCRMPIESPLPGIDAQRGITHRLGSRIASQFDRPIRSLMQDTGVRQSVVRDIVQPAAEACYGRQPGPPGGFALAGTKAAYHVTSPNRLDVYLRLTHHKPPCPECGSGNVQRSATYQRHLHDQPHEDRPVALVFKQYRVFRCQDCERNFGEPVPGIAAEPRHPRLTQRLVEWICTRADSQTEQDIAATAGVPVGTIRRVLTARGEPVKTFLPLDVSLTGWQPMPHTVVTRYAANGKEHHIHMRTVPSTGQCDRCGLQAVMCSWRRARAIRDVPLEGRHVILHYSGLVMRCTRCGQASEQPAPGIDTVLKTTDRLKQWIAERLRHEQPIDISRTVGLRLAQVNLIARKLRGGQRPAQLATGRQSASASTR